MKNEEKISSFGDFDDLANWFVQLGSHFSPSECHGALIGALSGGMRLESAKWSAFVYAIMGLDTDALDYATVEANQRQIQQFMAQELEALQSSELLFSPFLPDDEISVAERAESLGAWCKGFLGGFAEAQVYRQREGDILPTSYPENVMEAIKDVTEIAKATLRADQSQRVESSADFDEDGLLDDVQMFDPLLETQASYDENVSSDFDERDYVEVSEYVRLAALTVFTEFGWIEVLHRADEKSEPPKPPVLH